MLLAAFDWYQFFFVMFAAIACLFAAGVVFSTNIVRMAFYLIISLGATAGLFFLAGAEFVGAMQLMIYVGGTLVLLIFGVMLTANASFISMKTRGGEWILAAIFGGLLLTMLIYAAFQVPSWKTPREDVSSLEIADSKQSAPIGLAVVGVRVDKLDEEDENLAEGMSGYLLPFEIVSVHLLVVLIGAGYMARTKKVAPGGLAVRPAAPRDRKFPLFVMLVVGAGLLANLATGVACFLFAPQILDEIVKAGSVVSETGLMAAGVLLVVNAALLAAVLGWQKWALFALGLTTIALPLVLWASGLSIIWAVIVFVAAAAPLALMYYLICSGENNVCSQMD